MEIFHFLVDLRQDFLMMNVSQAFYEHIVLKQKQLVNNDQWKDILKNEAKMLWMNIGQFLPGNEQFKNYLHISFPDLDTLFEEHYLNSFYNLHEDKTHMHDDFRTLLIDTFNLQVDDHNLA